VSDPADLLNGLNQSIDREARFDAFPLADLPIPEPP